jgi:hypothetical protein
VGIREVLRVPKPWISKIITVIKKLKTFKHPSLIYTHDSPKELKR